MVLIAGRKHMDHLVCGTLNTHFPTKTLYDTSPNYSNPLTCSHCKALLQERIIYWSQMVSINKCQLAKRKANQVTAFHPIIGQLGWDAMTVSWWFNPDIWCFYTLNPDELYKRQKKALLLFIRPCKSPVSQFLY